MKTLKLSATGTSGMETYMNNFNVSDSIYGQAASQKTLAVGAIDFYSSSVIAGYSSQGPSTIRYPYTVYRIKPDVCGISSVSVTGAGGFTNPFYGTSAAAPHVAAACALIWAQNPTKTADEIRFLLMNGCDDKGINGYDCIYGYGLVNPYKSLWNHISNVVFPASVSIKSGGSINIVSTGDSTNKVWLAPQGTVSFSAGATMTFTGGTAVSIKVPDTPGTYNLYVVDSTGKASASSDATLTVFKQYILGDADGNDVVNVFDAVSILRYISGLESLADAKLTAADADGSGNVDVFDAVAVLRYVSGLSTSLGK